MTAQFPMVLKFHPVISMTDEQLFDFCQLNKDFRIERKANGEIVIMSPTGSENDQRNFDLIGQLGIWKKFDGTGRHTNLLGCLTNSSYAGNNTQGCE